MRKRLLLSPPHMTGREEEYVREAFESNWIAPLGPQVDAFEREFCQTVDAKHALALSSGTAAIHLGLQLLGVGPGDEVLVSSFTFAASVNPIVYLGGRPTFIDSERLSWNMDPALLEDILERRAREGRLPRAVLVVHLYGQTANLDPILRACGRYGVPLLEDAAEALGARYGERSPGTFGQVGAYSFNGNKIITTSGGGMLVSSDGDLVEHARKLATQARDPAPYYQHSEIGYNYRLSNILAAIGRGQLGALAERVAARRRNFDLYVELLRDLSGLQFMPEAPWGKSNRWLTCMTIEQDVFGADHEHVRLALEAENIDARPLWKPMHMQPVFEGYETVGGPVSSDLFGRGLCLPSGSSLTEEDIVRVATVIRSVARQ
jgi:dTDP-4-amino-4,6-dideoxygalactose transaminase